MKKAIVLCGGLLASGVFLPAGYAGQSVGDRQFTAMKSLVGEWQGYKDGARDEPVALSYELSGGGSVVVERIFKGTPREMVTMYHNNGDRLMLTHYCTLKNQPRMQSTGTDEKKISFGFVDGTNLNAKNDMHMHNLTVTRVDADRLQQDWTLYQGGKPGPTVTFHFVRK